MGAWSPSASRPASVASVTRGNRTIPTRQTTAKCESTSLFTKILFVAAVPDDPDCAGPP
jgi:hypothetical protein